MTAFASSADEHQRLQDLSNKWEPEATGPLVSERLSSSAITTEYASADPIYQTKTANLPHKYAQYRTCRGDGHCGWRAVAFSYFETLLRLGDKQKFREEETRLKSLVNLLNEVGYQEHIYEDWAEDTFDLLRETASSIDVHDDGAALLRAFNDDNRSRSIITYLKILTSAWIQTHPTEFAPFVAQPLRTYCASHVEAAVCEIDNIGMSALVEVLVKPAGFAVEILVLDRTPGDEANTFQFTPVDHNAIPLPDPPTIRLLYRPGHYDILYKMEDLHQPLPMTQPSARQQVFVALNHASTERFHVATAANNINDYEIPGLSMPVFSDPDYGWSNGPQYGFSGPTPLDLSAQRTATTPSYQSISTVQTSGYFSSAFPVETSSTALSLPPPSHHPLSISRGGPFRPSIYEYETSLTPTPSHPPLCQTAIFKNSHYNTAHFNNPDFEPEQWQPDSDYIPSDRSRKKSSHA